MNSSHRLQPEDAKRYIMGGHGKATLVGREARFTFKFGTPHDNKPNKPVFVSVLNGSDNDSSYMYIGYIKGSAFLPGKKGHPEAPSYQAFAWYFAKLQSDPAVAAQAEFLHEGVCARCGRTLTTPESIERGLGPECAKHC